MSVIGNFSPSVQYRFTLATEGGKGEFYVFTTSTTTTYVTEAVGGLRIKQIKTHDGISTANDIIKTYEYKDATFPTRSSGKLYYQPTYWGLVNNSTGGTVYLQVFATGVAPLSSFNGYHIAYPRVVELNNGNGKTEFVFASEAVAMQDNLWPQLPNLVPNKDGMMEVRKVFNSSNVEIARTQTQYTSESYGNIPGNIYKSNMFPICTAMTVQALVPFWRSYSIRNSFPFRVSVQTDIADGITTTTNYEYDANNRFFAPTAIQLTNSDGKISRTEHKYVHDYAAGNVRDQLLARNMIGEPFETLIKVNGTNVGGTRKIFGFFNSAGTYIGNSYVAGAHPRDYTHHNYEMTWVNGTATPTAPDGWVLRGTANAYDNKGNLTQFTLANWPAETFAYNAQGLLTNRYYQNFSWTYAYYPNTRRLQTMTDKDGQISTYEYDNLTRLKKVTARGGNAVAEYFYTYKNPASPGNTYNSVRTKNTLTPVAGSQVNIQETIQYLDGLGRPVQNVGKQQSPALKDVVSVIQYDNQGRAFKSFNPFEVATSTGEYAATVPNGTPFALTTFEASPLNRPLSNTPPEWYATTTAYGANLANEVKLDHAANTFYAANSLAKTTVTDPNGNKVTTWKDKKGRLVLTRRSDNAGTQTADTYHLYDDKDRSTLIIPPGAAHNSTNLTFAYTYDAADNLLSKKVPDAALVTMRYNTRDQLALEQDGNLLAQNKWRCIRYDDYGRPIKTGLYAGSAPGSIPTTLDPTDLHTENQYDGTLPIEKGRLKKAKVKVMNAAGAWLETNYSYDSYGRVSGTTGNNHLLPNDLNSETVAYTYDFGDRPLSDTRNSKQSASVTNSIAQNFTYDHWGRMKSTRHGVNGAAQTTVSEMNYDWKSQLIEKNIGKTATSHLQSLDFAYNAQGWLSTFNTPTLNTGTNAALNVCASNPSMPAPATGSSLDGNDLFYFELRYDVLHSGLSGSIQKNGNISQMVWRTRGRERQAYTFSYDHLDRLTDAQYADINDAGTVTLNNRLREKPTYDARGNILTLQREGLYMASQSATCWTPGQIDNLTYTYWTGTNRLRSITDNAPAASKAQGWNKTSNPTASTTYNYDANGNLRYDPAKGMDVTYNHLNLPTRMFWTNLSTFLTKDIQILYDGTGRKLQKKVTDENGVLLYQQDYLNGIEYRTTPAKALTLEAIYHSEGRVYNINATSASTVVSLRYEYTLKDHLGNSRITFTDKNANGVIEVTNTAANEVLQENHYYAFGLNAAGPWMNDAAMDTRYQYNGKELNDDFGLNWNDYGARWYDATLGRWWVIDPLVEKTYSYTTYNYAKNTPITHIDIWGMEAVFHANGNISLTGIDAQNYFRGLLKNNAPKQQNQSKWQDEWYKSTGFPLFTLALANGFSTSGALLVLSQAYNENATTESGRKRAYNNNNWWNMRPLNNKYRKESRGKDGWATYSNLDDAFCAYVWRMTSPSNLIEYKNTGSEGEFNPSYPGFGDILKNKNLPTAEEIKASLRIGTGQYEFCAGCLNYGNELLNLTKGTVRNDILNYMNKELINMNERLKVLNSESSKNSNEIIRVQTGINQYLHYIKNIQNVK